MKYYKDYIKHKFEVKGKRVKYDTNIYSLDIETSSYLILNGEILPAIEYENLTKKEQEKAIKQSNMYIWMFSINTDVYYGRTWSEFRDFLELVFGESKNYKKIIFVHNLSFEFQYLKSIITFDEVQARIRNKPMKAINNEYNLEFRCSYFMSNCKLAKLPKLYNLPIKKMEGDLDYKLIRHSETPLTEKELGYCENDCLVVYYYIKYELQSYDDVYHLPLTSTGHVRRELQELTRTNYSYKSKVRKAVNTDGHIYNLLITAFSGGYTHANYLYTDEIIKNVDSWDFTSSYPYVMTTCKFPMKKFRKSNIKDVKEFSSNYAYLVRIRFKNIESKYFNHFLSKSKCLYINKSVCDNGRIIKAEEVELVLTDIDIKVIFMSYNFESYEILECYYSHYDYLPKQLIEFILDKYVKKTKFKDDPEHELEYQKEKALFNSIYGMTVTNTIRPQVTFDGTNWNEELLTNDEILDILQKEEKKGFLEFSWGVWITAYARYNLLTNIMKLDKYLVYSDTDSVKVKKGYKKDVIDEYNYSVYMKLAQVSKDLNIPIEKYMPEDIHGVKRPLGVFDDDGHYTKFITQGAKKYAFEKINKKGEKELGITVSGVPKSGVKCLNGDINNFRDNLIFDYKYTNKNTVLKCEEQESVILEDYLGNKYEVNDRSGFCLLPTTYSLNKADEYFHLLSENSTLRQKYKE